MEVKNKYNTVKGSDEKSLLPTALFKIQES